MLNRRIITIYTKELTELLRDRRTLIAMIVVPIALYPLLIIGSVHLLSVQDGERKTERMTIGIQYDPQYPEQQQPATRYLGRQLQAAKRIIRENRDSETDDVVSNGIESIDRMDVVVVDDVSHAVEMGACHVGVLFSIDENDRQHPAQHTVTIKYDKAELRSESAAVRLREVFDLLSRSLTEEILEQENLPLWILDPIHVSTENVATPQKVGGMVLGSIVPLVLVLMTITGAIYPAIDLTAGERERGTLETLIVCPVPPVELMTGKYLVVATVAMMGAALNLISMGATLHFGGFTDMISASGDTELPLEVLPVILVVLVPFAMLFSAIMVAVCSYARTFKEAQNYIMPVILAALIPGGVAAMPGTQLSGINAYVPVMNMVLLAREMLLGHFEWLTITKVMLSTCVYAGSAVMVASRVFSTEAAIFADSASLKASFSRQFMRPTNYPTSTLALITTAILFPVWMFVQFSIQPGADESALHTFKMTAWLMPIALVAIPVVLLSYFKVQIGSALGLSKASPRYIVAAILIGIGGWIPAHELFAFQHIISPVPKAILDSNDTLMSAFENQGLWLPLLLIAVIPAICEELFFRGFLLGGLRKTTKKWPAIIIVGCVFAIFHIILIKFVITAVLGILLGYLCWQSRSIIPSILAHMLHNGIAVTIAFVPGISERMGIDKLAPTDHLPIHIIAIGTSLVIAGTVMAAKRSTTSN
ncbi:MAG: sodium extrusion protein NatB [Phycisphaerae bacterium]|nr:MAG: sodium extrusion protein NatB [Phycisphaerae bacterium]